MSLTRIAKALERIVDLLENRPILSATTPEPEKQTICSLCSNDANGDSVCFMCKREASIRNMNEMMSRLPKR